MLTISRAKKFIFLHIPKTGGTSIAHALSDYADVEIQEYHIHSRMGVCRGLLTDEEIENFYKFCVVRNPWDWMVSLYFDHLSRPDFNITAYNFVKENSFSKFIDYVAMKMQIDQSMWLLEGDKLIFDKVIKFEKLNVEFDEVCQGLDIFCQLPKLNATSGRPDYQFMYDEETDSKIRHYFARDIEVLGYKFDIPSQDRRKMIDPEIKKFTEICITKSDALIERLTNENNDKLFLFSLAQHYAGSGEFSKAEEKYLRLMDIDPLNSRYYLALSFVLDRMDRVQEGLVAINEAIRLDGLMHEAHAQLGNLCSRLGRLPDAEAAYRRAIEIAPDNGGYRYALSFVLDRLGRVDEALAAALEAIDHSPLLHEAHAQLGHLYSHVGRLPDAEAAYRRAFEIAPDNGGYRYALSFVLDRLGRVDEALAAALEAIDHSPLLHEAHAHLGHLYSRVGRLSDAEAACHRAIEIAPDNGGYHYAQSLVLNRLERMDETLAAALKAVSINPMLHEAYGHLAHLFDRFSRLAESEAAARHAVSIIPENAVYRYVLSYAIYRQGRIEEALSPARGAVERDPFLQDAQAHLAHVCIRAGRYTDAEAVCHRAIALAPERLDYRKMLETAISLNQ